MRTLFTLAALPVVAVVVLGAQASRPGQQPARDTPARQAAEAAPTPAPSARIKGRILAADTGRPVSRARVLLTGAALPEGRATLTDNDGFFELSDLSEGRYTLTAAKAGFITVSYGQRRPFQSGTPLQLGSDQQMTGVDMRLPRGSVISGRVVDENGDPLPGAAVRVLRYQYAQGNRQLMPVGSAQTDDLGAYRVWGLNPGQYYVSVVLPPLRLGGRGRPAGVPLALGRGGPGGRAGRGAITEPEPEQVGYAPTFYPGVPSITEARPVNLALSAEATGIDLGVLLVRTALIAGRVTNPDGSATTAGIVSLIGEEGGRPGRGGPGGAYSSRIDWDGSFSLFAVPPGRYTLRARSDDTTEPQFALQPIVVTGDDLPDLTVVLTPAASLSGTVRFQTTQASVPDTGQVRIAAPLADGATLGPNPTARVDRNGTFTLDGLQAGSHLLRVQGNLRGWMLQSVLVNGRDMADTPIDLRSGQTLTGVQLVFTDRLTEVNGTVSDERGTPSTDYTLLAFAADDALWRPMSRHIATTRPDQNGRFQMRGLPPGDYFLALVDPIEQGEWFEPSFLEAQRAEATRISLVDGDTKTQNFTISSP